MAKNDILSSCKVTEDFDMEEEYMGQENFNEEENKVFCYTYEVSPIITQMMHRAYFLEDIKALIAQNSNSGCNVYFDYDDENDKYLVRCEKGEIEGYKPSKRNSYKKEAAEVFEEFLNELHHFSI